MSCPHKVFIGNYSFDLGLILGKGTTGNVYQGVRNQDERSVAVKVISLNQNQNEIGRKLLQTQKKALQSLRPHGNVIRLLDIIQDKQFCYIVTQLYNGGTLKDYLRKRGNLSSQEAVKMFRKIVSGYCAISDASIIHRDLKPANIMLNQTFEEPVIIDFGFCQIIQTQTVMTAFNVGSPSYMSPQAYRRTLYSQKSDIWSLGVILYEMLTGKTLDSAVQSKNFFECISDVFLSHKVSQFQGIVQQILSQVLKLNPCERISCHKIKYILDKDAIQKLKGHDREIRPSKFNLSVIQKYFKANQKMQDSSLFQQNQNKKAHMVTYQSVPLKISRQHYCQGQKSNISSSLTILSGGLGFKSKLAQSRYRTNFSSPPQNNQNNLKQVPKVVELRQSMNLTHNAVFRGVQVREKETWSQNIQMIKSIENRNNQNERYEVRSKQNNYKQKPMIQFSLMRQKQKFTNIPNQKAQTPGAYFKDTNFMAENTNSTLRQPMVAIAERQQNYFNMQDGNSWMQNMENRNMLKQTVNLNSEGIKPQASNLHKFSFKGVGSLGNYDAFPNGKQNRSPHLFNPSNLTICSQIKTTHQPTFDHQTAKNLNQYRNYNNNNNGLNYVNSSPKITLVAPKAAYFMKTQNTLKLRLL